MRSYALAIAASMLLAAIYVFQNVDEVTVRFLIFERVFPQGVWEALLFSIGAVIMWVFSLFASLEIRGNYRTKVKDRDKKIHDLEAEKTSLLDAISKMGAKSEYKLEGKPYVGLGDTPLPPLSENSPQSDTETF